jgi:amidohydrolase
MYDFFYEADKYYNTMVKIRRKLHMHPELGRDLFFTANLVESILKEADISYKRFKNNGIVAEIGSGRRGIALRADMDAIPVQDMKDVSYKSKINGVMHACGHDAHTAIQIGSALILKNIESELNGKVRFIFQPAEETDGGAKDMIEYGALKDVQAVIALHVDENLNTGTIGFRKGVVNAASNPFKIEVKGKSAHGAHPENSIDAIYIASKIIDSLQMLVSRELSPLDSAAISIGKINGGTAENIICGEVTMEGILRSFGAANRQRFQDRIKTIVESTASMFRGLGKVDFVDGYPSFENDDDLYDFAYKVFGHSEDVKIVKLECPNMTVEDFAYYTQEVPGFYYKLGCRNINQGIVNPAHGSYFDVDEACLPIGCALQSMFAFEYLNR